MAKDYIKNVSPTRNVQYMQGYFEPKNANKYKGQFPIIYRSAWELKFMQLLDSSPNIIEWASEPVGIEYTNPLDGRLHTYYVDFYFSVQTESALRKVIAEVKPKRQINLPKKPKNNTIKSLENYRRAAEIYIVNQSKFNAANLYATDRGMEFVVITEDFLFSQKL